MSQFSCQIEKYNFPPHIRRVCSGQQKHLQRTKNKKPPTKNSRISVKSFHHTFDREEIGKTNNHTLVPPEEDTVSLEQSKTDVVFSAPDFPPSTRICAQKHSAIKLIKLDNSERWVSEWRRKNSVLFEWKVENLGYKVSDFYWWGHFGVFLYLVWGKIYELWWKMSFGCFD